MIDTAVAALSRRSVELAEALAVKDELLDRLSRGMLDDLKKYAMNEDDFTWAMNLVLVARHLERMGDHIVDIGEQTHFLVTGVFREFTDASHPGRADALGE